MFIASIADSNTLVSGYAIMGIRGQFLAILALSTFDPFAVLILD
jgi:hypothetical protein